MRKDAARGAIVSLAEGQLIERAPSWTAAKPHHTMAAGTGEDAIFLPVELVMGLTGSETPMLARVRETGDPLLLRLLIDLYGEVTTDAPHAVALSSMRGYYSKGPGAKKALEIGAHTVWELFDGDTAEASGLDHSRYISEGEDDAYFWHRVSLLEKLGAVYSERWVCSNSSIAADPLFPINEAAGVEPLAEAAALALLEGPDHERAWKCEQHLGGWLIVLPAHHQVPAIQWLANLRLEADTPGRGAYGERSRITAHWAEQYGRLALEAAEGNFSNPLRTQPPKRSERPHQGDQSHQSAQG